MSLRARRAEFVGQGLELRVGFVAGGAANADLTVPGLAPTASLVSVLELQPPTATSGGAIVADRTAACTIPAADTLRCSAATTGNQLLVIWWA
jgi:hypothetical protein